MIDRFDAWLETGLRDLERAVPLGQSVADRLDPAALVRMSDRGTRSRRPVGSLIAAAVAIVILAILLPRFNAAVPGTSQTTAPSPNPTTSSPSPSQSLPDEVTHHLGPFSIVTPTSWQLITPYKWTQPVGPVLFVSNAPIADPCPTVNLGARCLAPLSQLPPDGIVVTISGWAIPSLPNPSPIPVDEPVNGACATMRGERELGVRFQGFDVVACLRGPDFAANEAAFDRLIASIPGPPPPQGTSVTKAFTIANTSITLSPPGNAVPATSSDAAYRLCQIPGGASCQPGPPTSILLARFTERIPDTTSALAKPGTLVWVMGWIGVTTCASSGGGPSSPGPSGDSSPVATPGQPLCDAYNFIDATSGKFILGLRGPHN
ncbi:MAG: hypothetical protein ACRDGQ_04390 [Candidatus Limnocylindrales bacterium]